MKRLLMICASSLALCAAGSGAVAEAEALGVPALIHDPPNPLGDRARTTFG